MLPEVTLKDISREDVDRVAWWLEDTEVSSRWFGHYGCGEPVHRGYDPLHMIEAADAEWSRVFGDTHRLIYSVYNAEDEHIGECQFIMDAQGGAELSVLIGRKDLWHRGYGTSVVMVMLDRVFAAFHLDRAWVNVPEDNLPALGLFENLGFMREAVHELCKRPDGSALNATILVMDLATYQARRPSASRPKTVPVVTIHGLPGSGADAIGEEIARLTGARFVGAELIERVCRRLRCTPGELAAFEQSYSSVWARLINSIVVPMEWSVTYDTGYQWFTSEPMAGEGYGPEDQISKKQYVEALASAVRRFAAEGNVVLNAHGSQLFAPLSPGTINVLFSASKSLRQRRISEQHGLEEDDAQRWLEKADRNMLAVFKNLLGADMLDKSHYDLTVNLDHISPESATRMVVGALEASAEPSRGKINAHTAEAPVG